MAYRWGRGLAFVLVCLFFLLIVMYKRSRSGFSGLFWLTGVEMRLCSSERLFNGAKGQNWL